MVMLLVAVLGTYQADCTLSHLMQNLAKLRADRIQRIQNFATDFGNQISPTWYPTVNGNGVDQTTTTGNQQQQGSTIFRGPLRTLRQRHFNHHATKGANSGSRFTTQAAIASSEYHQ